jgi:hypothetical protein
MRRTISFCLIYDSTGYVAIIISYGMDGRAIKQKNRSHKDEAK